MPEEDGHIMNQLFRQLGFNTISALESIYQLLFPDLFNISNHLLKNQSWAKEVVVGVFLALWENRVHVSKMENPVGWLYKLTYHNSLNFLRTEKRHRPSIDNIIDNQYLLDVAKDLEAKELSAYVQKAMEQLPEQQKKIIKLSYEGWNRKEIASMTKLSESTVKNHITKAHKNLRNIFKNNSDYFI